jgi:hypothetical protein
LRIKLADLVAQASPDEVLGRDNQQIPFQFSAHRLSRSGELKHATFLDVTGEDPSRRFAAALVEACGSKGPIFVYNAGFEKARIGISQLPMIVEAVFPVGPLAVSIGPQGKLQGPAHRILRFEIPKSDGKTIPTWAFLHEQFANVSAVIQGYQKHLIDRTLELTTVHNPLAVNRRLALGLFGRTQEFVATPDGDSYLLRDVAAAD